MTNLQKLNKAFIGVIIVVAFAYILQIVDLSFFANDLSQVTSQIKMITEFVPNQDVQNINSIIDFVNNTAGVIRGLIVTFAVVAGIISMISLFVVKAFANRLPKYQSVFTLCGLAIASIVTIFIQVKLFPTFNGLVSLILICATLLAIVFAVIYTVVACVQMYKLIMSDEFNAGQLGFDFAKVLSFIFIFYVGVILATKVSLYMSMVVLVREVDLASLIDVMNYINIDWETILPPAIFATGIISSDRIDFLINNAADQYILSYASTFIQNVILDISRSIIFNNIVVYITTLVTSVAILVNAKNKYQYKNYIALGLMVLMAVIGFVYIGGLITNLLAIGFVICIILTSVEIYKQFK